MENPIFVENLFLPLERCQRTILPDFNEESIVKDFYIDERDDEIVRFSQIRSTLKKLLEPEEKKVHELFKSSPPAMIRHFLKDEMKHLKMSENPRYRDYLKQKLDIYEKPERSTKPVTIRSLKERCFWFRRLNMFIFGVNRYAMGDKYYRNLYKITEGKQEKMFATERRILHRSYMYIFGKDQQFGVDYHNALKKTHRKRRYN